MVLRRRSQCVSPLRRCSILQNEPEEKLVTVSDVLEEESSNNNTDNNDNNNATTSPIQQSSSTSVWLSTKCMNNNSDEAQSSHNLSGWSSWIIQSNITRLQTAHNLLAPVVHYIINFASSYTNSELYFKLTEREPICEISSMQYAHALRASEIIAEVCNDLTSVDYAFNSSPKMIFNVTPASAKASLAEDHRTNLKQMGERIFIDRDLIKQLMELHELITDTIEQLKVSLDQISIEGMPMERHDVKMRGPSLQTDIENNFEIIDRNLIRRDIVKNFIVVGEPKNAQCYYAEANNNEKELVIQQTKAHKTFEQMDRSVAEEDESRKHSGKRRRSNDKPQKSAEKPQKKGKRKSASSTKQLLEVQSSSSLKEVVTRVDNVKPLNTEPERPPCMIRNERCPLTLCGNDVKSSVLMNVKELEQIWGKRASFTVGVRSYHLKCDEDVSMACAVLPNDPPIQDKQMEMAGEDNDDAPLVIAESDSADFEKPTEPPSENASTHVLIPGSLDNDYTIVKDKNVSCELTCIDVESARCRREYVELRRFFEEMAYEVATLERFISFEDMSYDELGYDALAEEYAIKQKIIHCMRHFRQLKKVLMELNFSEVEAKKPDQRECCERNYTHVHCEVLGIPISVRITGSYMDMLMPKYDQPVQRTYKNRGCDCKPPMSFKELFKEKCALSHMLRSRNNLSDKNRVVMINLQQLQDDIFAMPLKTDQVVISNKSEEFRPGDNISEVDLPYVVSRRSLPKLQTCEAKHVTLEELKSRMRDMEIQHPNPNVMRYLKNLGIDNLIKASMPAKCCNATVINEEEQPNEPLRASLNSLPLTTSDLDMITDIATSVKLYETCKYRPINFYINVSFKFKFEKYTNFQEFVRPKMRVYQIFYFEIFKKDNHATGSTRCNRLMRSHRHHHERNSEKSTTHNFVVAFLRRFVFLTESNEKNNKKHEETKKEHKHKSRSTSPHRVKRRTSSSSGKEQIPKKCTKRDRRVQTWPHEIDRHMKFESIREEDEHTSKTYTIPQTSESWKNEEEIRKRTIPEKKVEVRFEPRYKLQRNKTLINRTMHQKEKKNQSIHVAKSVYSTKKYRQYPPEMQDSKSDNLVKKSYNKEVVENIVQFDIPPHCADNDLQKVDSSSTEEKLEFRERPMSENLGTIFESDEKSTTPERVVEVLTKNEVPPDEFWSMYFNARRSALQTPSNTYTLTSDEEQIHHRKKRLRSRIPKRIQFSDSSSDFSTSCQSTVPVRKPSPHTRTLPPSPKSSRESSRSKQQIPKNEKCDELRTNYFVEYNLLPKTPLPTQNHSRERTNYTRSKHGIEQKKTAENLPKSNAPDKSYLSDIMEDTERNTTNSNDMKTIQSLQMLATKHGPGYITVLHPICGCPEVSIFIPCYCDDLDAPKRKPLSFHRMNKLLSDKRGRHIILQARTRIPLAAQTMHRYRSTRRINNLPT